MQDTAAADIWGDYSAIKHDLFIIGHDGALRADFSGAKQLDPDSPVDQQTLRNALIAAMP